MFHNGIRCAAVVLVVGVLGATACGAADKAQVEALRRALTFHAGFDRSFDAGYAKGNAKLHTASSFARKDAKPGNGRGDLSIISDGRFGGAVRFGDKSKKVVFFHAEKNMPYEKQKWSGTVSVWMRLDPDKDLKPGYADPIQITDKRWNDASFFLDFTKDDKPRHFRLGSFSDLKFWNAKNIKWEKVPVAERPMVVVNTPVFSRKRWTHVLFTFSGFNVKGESGSATLYIDGKKQGTLQRPQQYSWNPKNAAIMIGLSYIGDMDDLAIFNRALTAAEVKSLHQLENGVRDLSAK